MLQSSSEKALLLAVATLPIGPNIDSTFSEYTVCVSADTHHLRNSHAFSVFLESFVIPQPVPSAEDEKFISPLPVLTPGGNAAGC